MGNIREPFGPDTIYHVYNHGNAEDIIFREDKNYEFFLKKYRKYISGIADTYAYCLMPNHFHVMVRIKKRDRLLKFFKDKNPQGFHNPEGLSSRKLSNLISHQFGTLLNSYTKAYNKLYDRKGSLFRNTFKRKPITGDGYYIRLIRYIHRNPIKHGFVENITDYPYSSYKSLLSDKPTSLEREKVLGRFGGRENFVKAHQN